ncbi:MAG: exodeoxyribonuclease VII small subunit [Ruminococcus sp.]|jgi:exodeoxyribonuclease VII small subunit|nr:exodeoxyribonuclease VII small subunit [Ruminococcus sp.]
MTEKSLEEIFAELDAITKQMEKSGLALDESLKLYKAAVSAIEIAKEKLRAAKAEIDAVEAE